MKISIIIPNFNGAENLNENLPRVLAAMKNYSGESELIVIDDNSSDESLGHLGQFCKGAVFAPIGRQNAAPTEKIKIIQNSKNLGFAASCNVGAKEASGGVIVLLNSDVSPEENFLNPLIEHFKDEKVFAVGCLEKNINEKNEIIDEHGVGKLFFKNGIFQHCKGDLNSKTTDWVCGGSGAFRRETFLKLGGFDVRFAPFYWEDIDLSCRAKKIGYKLLFERTSIIYHQHIAGSIVRKYSSQEIEKISLCNQLLFTQKHICSISQTIGFAFFLLKLSIKRILSTKKTT